MSSDDEKIRFVLGPRQFRARLRARAQGASRRQEATVALPGLLARPSGAVQVLHSTGSEKFVYIFEIFRGIIQKAYKGCQVCFAGKSLNHYAGKS